MAKLILNSKENSFLRSKGQTLEAELHIGKEGITEEVVNSLNTLFNSRELIKGRVLKSSPIEVKEAANILAEETSSAFAGSVGFTFLLYRPNKELKHRLVLPKKQVEIQE